MSKITVTTIAGQTSGADANTVKIESGDTLAVQSNATVGGTLGVTGATTATGGVTIPASTTVGLNFGSGTDLAQLAMQSGVSDRIALRTTHTSTGDNNPFIIYQPSSAGAQNDALVVNTGGQVTMSKQPSWFQYVIGGGTFSSGWKNVPLNPNASTDFPYHIAGGVTTANGNHEVTVPVAGHYQINGAVTLDSGSVNTDGTLTLSKNNSTMSGGQSSGVDSGALGGTTISYVVELAANDTVGLDYYFSGSATYRNTAYAGYFSGYLLG